MELVAIDMDGTLLRDDKTYDIEMFADILEKLKQRKIKLCIASGNTYPRLLKYLGNLDGKGIYFASDNGTQVYLNGEKLFTAAISRYASQELIDKLGNDDQYQIVMSTGGSAYTLHIADNEIDRVKVFYHNLQFIDSLADIPAAEEIVKIAVLSSKGDASDKNIVQEIMDQFSGLTAVTSGGRWFDIFNQEGGKGQAIAKLQAKYDIHKQQTIAFGDSMNDADMMYQADYSVGVAEADEALMAICRYQIGSNNDQAVFQVLNEILTNNIKDVMTKYEC